MTITQATEEQWQQVQAKIDETVQDQTKQFSDEFIRKSTRAVLPEWKDSLVLICDSPYSSVLTYGLFKSAQLNGQLNDQLRGQLHDQLRSQSLSLPLFQRYQQC